MLHVSLYIWCVFACVDACVCVYVCVCVSVSVCVEGAYVCVLAHWQEPRIDYSLDQMLFPSCDF